MKAKYEISIWEDVLSEDEQSFIEKKIITIGSNTMTSENRAREPKLVSNINGTNTFTFNLIYSYINTITGERVQNPYVKFLVNERKIKVLWKDKWYDFLIKSIKEDQVSHIFSYTCEDAYITELSRTGFELVFDTELENNIGTASELVEKVIENTDWVYDDTNSDVIYQETEEPVYEVEILNQFPAKKNPDDQTFYIPAGREALVFYSYAPDINNLKDSIQFYYSSEGVWKQDKNDMLVINGSSYSVTVFWQVDESANTATAVKENYGELFKINFAKGLSTRYRAKRYVQSQKTVYNNIVNRYVNVYNYTDSKGTKEIYGYSSTEFNDALTVVNLITNSSNFSNTSGWVSDGTFFKLSPEFDKNTNWSKYSAKSYLYLKKPDNTTGLHFNTGIQNNRSYIPNGFIAGETYICRIKAKQSGEEPSKTGYITRPNVIIPSVYGRTSDYKQDLTRQYFISDSGHQASDNWLEYKMTCIESCPYEKLISTQYPMGFFLETTVNCWLEEIQFFREVYTESGERINPNEITTSVQQIVWKYFDAIQPQDVTKDTLEYIYTSAGEWSEAKPVYNNYQRYSSIEADNSNRFNILQSIAESFECWVRFEVEHDETGHIIYKDGKPRKLIQLKREAGQETGIGFIYGIDLKSVSRTVKSDKISTKTIVEQNENEFGKNGFCSIARSEENYPRENFIYNFDYYIQQGLLNREILYKDLYTTTGLAYYSNLHNYNTRYAKLLEEITNKRLELTKQNASLTVYNQYVLSTTEELQSVEESIMKLAGVTSIDSGLVYASQHATDTKVQALVNDRTQLQISLGQYQSLFDNLKTSVEGLTEDIKSKQSEMDGIIDELTALNKQFYSKYSRFIQEGTWSSEDYWDDDLYYLDAVQVAYTSSKPQVSYEINVLRISDLDDYSSKVFNLGDISFVQDTEYFGYKDDGITPYKEKVILTELTSYFETPDKDSIKVQNYKTQFDDLFQRITAAVQNLEFNQGKYAKAADIVASDGTIKSSVIQNTFNENKDLVYGAQNESVLIDNTGITVTDTTEAAKLVKVTSGGVFVSADGGATWKNAVRGDGINTDLLTAGRINTEQITVYNGDYPSFRWDANGLNAYKFNGDGVVDTTQFVRFDQYGIYGLQGAPEVYIPTSEQQIYDDANFGLTWTKFFMKSKKGTSYVEISTDRDIVVSANGIDRIVIGRVESSESSNYGIIVRNGQGNTVFQCDDNGSFLSGWTLNEQYLQSRVTTSGGSIRIQADGNIGCYGQPASKSSESAYIVTLTNGISNGNTNLKPLNDTSGHVFFKNDTIYPFVSSIGKIKTQKVVNGGYNSSQNNNPLEIPAPPSVIQFSIGNGKNYQLSNLTWTVQVVGADHVTTTGSTVNNVQTKITTYTYYFTLVAKLGGVELFTINSNPHSENLTRTANQTYYIPASNTKWYIDNNGDAVFHEIMADGGSIAGWWIDSTSLYQTKDGTRNRTKNGASNIKTELSSTGTAKGIDGIDYTFITDAINAAIATLGGVLMSGGLINGQNIQNVANTAQQALNLASQANSAIRNAASASDLSRLSTKVGQIENYVNNLLHHYHYYIQPLPDAAGGYTPTSGIGYS